MNVSSPSLTPKETSLLFIEVQYKARQAIVRKILNRMFPAPPKTHLVLGNGEKKSVYWEILFWPLILLLDGSRHFNTLDQERVLGDLDPEVFGRNTQEDCKFKETYEHSSSLDRLIQKLIEEEKERIFKKQQAKFSHVKK
ncbi:hypothetical protein TNCV_452111 [Trichonephila clavipes]|nr:hypothetical protein TNCV_452111 [Trichonephila clavipes]